MFLLFIPQRGLGERNRKIIQSVVYSTFRPKNNKTMNNTAENGTVIAMKTPVKKNIASPPMVPPSGDDITSVETFIKVKIVNNPPVTK